MTALTSAEASTPAAASSTTAAKASAPGFTYLALKRLRESATNPRRLFGALDELAASIRTHGVLEPLVVRPVAAPRGQADHEIVAGHRRFRAATIAELGEVPCIVRVLDDRETLEIQIIENLQREGLHELDEADGYGELLERHGYTADSLAEKIGKSRAYVYARLKLRSLTQVCRDAWVNGELTASTALYVARIPTPKLQEQALKEITKGRWGDEEEPMTAREAQDWISRQYMLVLAEAPFSRDDANLVPAAGSCTACPLRTGNNPDLFRDVRGADVCTSPDCYRSKLDAEWARRKAAAAGLGVKVLSPPETKEVIQNGRIRYDHKEYTRLEDYSPQLCKHWGEALGKKAPPVAALARDEDGNIVELHRVSALLKAAKDAGITRATKISEADKRFREQQKRDREKREDEQIRIGNAARELGDAAQQRDDPRLWFAVALAQIDCTAGIDPKKLSDIAKRRACSGPLDPRALDDDARELLEDRLVEGATCASAGASGGMTASAARALAVELLAYGRGYPSDNVVNELRHVLTMAKPAAAAKKAPAKAATAKKPAKKPAKKASKAPPARKKR